MMNFLKKLWGITADLAWTLAGSIIVLVTLSGKTQSIALWITVIATVIHYVYKLISTEEK